MSRLTTQHRTLVLGDILDAPVSLVFSLFADPSHRQQLGTANGQLFCQFVTADFRVGGTDTFRFGRRSTLYRGLTYYHDIVPGRRIVATEVVELDDKRLSITMFTLDFAACGSGTELRLTAQMVTLEDGDRHQEATLRCETLVAALRKLSSRLTVR